MIKRIFYVAALLFFLFAIFFSVIVLSSWVCLFISSILFSLAAAKLVENERTGK